VTDIQAEKVVQINSKKLSEMVVQTYSYIQTEWDRPAVTYSDRIGPTD